MKWHTEKRKIKELIPFSDNPRILTEKQYKNLERSLKKFDLAEIPAINTDNLILAGHQRLQLLRDLGRGDEEIDVRVPDRKLTDKESREYNIRSNKNTGEWDFDKLANGFEQDDLIEWGFSPIEVGKVVDKETSDAAGDESLNEENSVMIKIIYIDSADWISWRNKIVNYLSQNNINFRVDE